MSHRSSDLFQIEPPQFIFQNKQLKNNTQRSRQDNMFKFTHRQTNALKNTNPMSFRSSNRYFETSHQQKDQEGSLINKVEDVK